MTEYHCRPRLTMRGRAVCVVFASVVALALYRPLARGGDQSPGRPPSVRTLAALAWPQQGSAALLLPGGSPMTNAANDSPVPIASLAKVMTAYVVLRLDPLGPQDAGFTLTFDADDVVQTRAEAALGESVVTVAAGEQMTEHQALQALLLPSANNVALALARRVGRTTFLRAMNHAAARLGMTATSYTDPSGLDPTTTSTAMDQLRLVKAALDIPVFADIVEQSQASEPIVGTVRNTDTLLGQDGFRGVKTGSDQAAGGCFVFRAEATVGESSSQILGVVLGQRAGPLIPAALTAARSLVDSARQRQETRDTKVR